MSSSALPPTAPTTLVILLGASAWPNSPGFQASRAFAHAAQGFRNYLLNPQGFGLPAVNLFDQFDALASASDQLEMLGFFLEQRAQTLKAVNQAVRDVLVYFVGHGGFTGPSADFYLLLRRTNASSLRASGMAIDALAEVLREKARQTRRYLFLDCCFSAAAFRSFQGGPDQIAITKTLDAFAVRARSRGFPRKGTVLLCSSDQKSPSLLLPDESCTMFSHALLDVLRNGDLHRAPQLSLRDIKELAEDRLMALPEKNAPRPGLLSPDQSEGDVADVPFFANPCAQEERHRWAEAAEQARLAEKKRIRTIEEQTPPLLSQTFPPTTSSQRSAILPPPLPPRQPKRMHSPPVVLILLTLILLGGGSFGIYAIGHLPWNPPQGQSGNTWTVQNSGASNPLDGVVWSGSQFVVVGWSGTILTSPDGSNWTPHTAFTSAYLRSIAWSKTQFVVVGSNGTILTSPDGSNWIVQISQTTQELFGIVWSGSQFVVVGGSGLGGVILTSPDGDHWTVQTHTLQQLNGIAWSGSQFVVMGEYGAILTSPDGDHWTVQASHTTDTLNGVLWSGSQFVAVGLNGRILTSHNGSTWTAQISGTPESFNDVAWSGSQFVVVGGSGIILTSPDGSSWIVHSVHTSDLWSVTWSGSQFVIVGESGVGNNGIILTSP